METLIYTMAQYPEKLPFGISLTKLISLITLHIVTVNPEILLVWMGLIMTSGVIVLNWD